jgi:hypothetical protein
MRDDNDADIDPLFAWALCGVVAWVIILLAVHWFTGRF